MRDAMPDSATRDQQHPDAPRDTTATMLQDRYEPFKRLAMIQLHPPPNPNKPLTPFSITDILNGRTCRRSDQRRNCGAGTGSGAAVGPMPGSVHFAPTNSRLFRSQPLRIRTPAGEPKSFLRPWDDVTSPSNSTSDDNEEEIDIEEEKPPQAKSVSPLDALFQMTSKTFDGRGPDGSLQPDGLRREQLNLFAKAQPAKKRRKSRTAFTNQQIYELEKRFLYQKYLTPADRDEIAQNLGLTNAQVITWFQNRRAKLKRDLEELKADVTAAKHLSDDDSVLPNVAHIDEIQLFNKHGLKRVDKKSSHSMTVTSASSTNVSTSATRPEHDCHRTKSPEVDSNGGGGVGGGGGGGCGAHAQDSRQSTEAHAQSPASAGGGGGGGACASALSSPDSTTDPNKEVSSSHVTAEDNDKKRTNEAEAEEDDEEEEIDV